MYVLFSVRDNTRVTRIRTFLLTALMRSTAEKGDCPAGCWRPCGEGSCEVEARSPQATQVLQERLAWSSRGCETSAGRAAVSVTRLTQRRAGSASSGSSAMSPVLKLLDMPSMRLSRPQERSRSASSSHQTSPEAAPPAAAGTRSRAPAAGAGEGCRSLATSQVSDDMKLASVRSDSRLGERPATELQMLILGPSLPLITGRKGAGRKLASSRSQCSVLYELI